MNNKHETMARRKIEEITVFRFFFLVSNFFSLVYFFEIMKAKQLYTMN